MRREPDPNSAIILFVSACPQEPIHQHSSSPRSCRTAKSLHRLSPSPRNHWSHEQWQQSKDISWSLYIRLPTRYTSKISSSIRFGSSVLNLDSNTRKLSLKLNQHFTALSPPIITLALSSSSLTWKSGDGAAIPAPDF